MSIPTLCDGLAKILHISNFRNRGGGTALARQLVQHHPDGSILLFLEYNHIRATPEGHTPAEYACHVWDLAFIRTVVKALIEENGGLIIHCHGRRPGLLGQYLRLLFPKHIRVVLSFHGIASFGWTKKKFVALQECVLSLFTDQFIAAAPAEMNMFRYVPLAAPTVMIPNSFNADAVAPWLPRPIRRIGFCGRFERPKRHADLIRIIAAYNARTDRPLTLVFSGDGSLRVDIDALGRHVLGEYYVSLGQMPDIREFYKQIDAFAHFSQYEGMPLSLIDALACGMPCIATDVIGCHDVIEHNISGLLVPLGDIQAGVDALKRLVEDEKEVIRLAMNARKRSQAAFSPEHFWRRHREVYERLTNDLGRPLY